jgi:hypothetical protein
MSLATSAYRQAGSETSLKYNSGNEIPPIVGMTLTINLYNTGKNSIKLSLK